MILRISCGQTLFFIQVDVVATSPSVQNWFEYSRYRTSDSASSGSLEMSDRMKTRGFSLKHWMGSPMLTNGPGYYELSVEMAAELLIGKGTCIHHIGDLMSELKVERIPYE